MSLLITSNTPENDAGQLTDGINRPFSYTNNLQDTLKIPANSEIAVQSVKINRDGVISINNGQQAGIYFGEELTSGQTNRQVNSFVSSNSILYTESWSAQYGDEFFVGSVENVAELLQRMGNRSMCHPNLLKNNDASVNPGFTCAVKRNASTQNFEGYQYTMRNADSSKNASNISVNWTANTGDFDKTGLRLLNDTGDLNYNIGVDFPLSQASGTFSASLVEENVFQEIGLTRCLGDTGGVDGEQYVPDWFDGANEDFYDYVVEIESDNEIKVFHSAEDGGGELSMVEYDYRWMNAGNYFNSSDDEIDRVDFNVKGERVKISLFKGATEYVLTDGTNATSASNVKPTNMNTRFLFPKIRLVDGGQIDIRGFDGVDIENFSYGNDLYGIPTQIDLQITPFLDWWPNHYNDDEAKTMDIDYVKSLVYTDQKGLNASNQVDYKTAIVTGFDTRYEYTTGLNTESLLGFVGRPLAFTPFTETLTTITYVSDNIPDLDSTSSIFVRVRNMTFDSVNFSKSAMSKILYHLPSFSQTGESTGALYFEPSERVYLKMNNVVDLYLSNIDVDLVRDDETLARDVTGKTTVLFHLRQSKD